MSFDKYKSVFPLYWWFLSIPVLILSLSYIFLAVEHNNLNLLFTKVHESGRYTLIETILYFDHFSREILICVITALAFAISFYIHVPLDNINTSSVRKAMNMSLSFLLIFLSLTISGAIYKKGMQGFFLDLLQFRTRDDVLAYGSHWHYHLLHLFFMAGAAMGLSFIYRDKSGISKAEMNRFAPLLIFIWAAAVCLFTLIFIPNLKPFTDTRYLAHEFREIVTHTTVSMPFAFACLIYLERKYTIRPSRHKITGSGIRTGMLYILGVSLIPLFIISRLIGRDIMSEAQKKNSFLDLFASHYFEHTLDYIFLTLLSIFFYTSFVYISIKMGLRGSKWVKSY
ncbi:MAG: hypothetical protein AB1632_01165 [Nitrospirota bacterium]